MTACMLIGCAPASDSTYIDSQDIHVKLRQAGLVHEQGLTYLQGPIASATSGGHPSLFSGSSM